MRRLAVLSLHTSPLAQPGTGDGGGMNVYVRELTAALARTGVTCDVFTRAWSADLPSVVDVEPGLRVHHVPAGPLDVLPKESLPAVVEQFTAGVLERMAAAPMSGGDGIGGLPYTSVHANYWLSGLSGHVIKHELNLPLVCTFHTLDRVKAESMPEEVEADMPHRRAEAEASIIDCSDAVLASCTVEAEQIASLYGGEPTRIRIVPPGVDHAFFGPGHRPQARRALGLPLDGRLLLFVGRIQPLKCADVAIETLAELLESGREPYRLVVVGGPSGPYGEKSLQRLSDVADGRGVRDHVHFVEPQPHELLSSYYRAADVCLVPSRSESFGLVALEAAACGTPVVASAVGGLTTLVDHGHTGFLVEDPDPAAYADAVRRVFARAAGGRASLHRLGAAGPPLHLACRGTDAGGAARRAGRGLPRRVRLSRHRPSPRACPSSISPRRRRWRPRSAASTPGPSASWPPAASSWRPSGRRSPTARRRTAGTCASRGTRRTSSPSGSPSSSGRCTSRPSSCRRPRPTTPTCTPTCCAATPTSSACGSRSAPRTPSTWWAGCRHAWSTTTSSIASPAPRCTTPTSTSRPP